MCVFVCQRACVCVGVPKHGAPLHPPLHPENVPCAVLCAIWCVCVPVCQSVSSPVRPPLHPGETKEKNKKPLWNTSSLASMLLHMAVGHGSRAYTHEKQLYTSIPFHQKCDRLTAVSNPLVCYLVCVCVCVCAETSRPPSPSLCTQEDRCKHQAKTLRKKYFLSCAFSCANVRVCVLCVGGVRPPVLPPCTQTVLSTGT
jgi:hypothetical protein